MMDEPDFDLLCTAYSRFQEKPGPDTINQLEGLAQRGSLMSMIYLAWAYRHGTGVNASDDKAEAWYQRAVDSGSQLATYYLGHYYLEKNEYSKAEEVFSIGASAEYSPAIYCLGCMYHEGTGVAKDVDKAYFLFIKGASLGHVFAKRSLASMYISGKYGAAKFFSGLLLLLSAFKNGVMLSITDPNNDSLRA